MPCDGTSIWHHILEMSRNVKFFSKMSKFPASAISIFTESEKNSKSNSPEVAIRRYFSKQFFLKNFALFAGKHLSWSRFLTKLQACRVFPVNIVKLLRTTFSTEHLRWLLLTLHIYTVFCFKNLFVPQYHVNLSQ